MLSESPVHGRKAYMARGPVPPDTEVGVLGPIITLGLMRYLAWLSKSISGLKGRTVPTYMVRGPVPPDTEIGLFVQLSVDFSLSFQPSDSTCLRTAHRSKMLTTGLPQVM
jgi:hypothetical protein